MARLLHHWCAMSMEQKLQLEPADDSVKSKTTAQSSTGGGYGGTDAALQKKFIVIPDNFIGPRLPNQVTQGEYQQIVATYRDMLLDKTDLHLNTRGMNDKDRVQFTGAAMNDISSIMQTPVGRVLIDRLAHQKEHFTTTLSLSKDEAGNPDTREARGGAANLIDEDHWSEGKGVNAVAQYVPGADVYLPGARDSFLPFRSDVALFHELTHAMHVTNGDMAPGKVIHGAQADIDAGLGSFEHQAVGIEDFSNETISENVYRSQRNLIGRNHGGIQASSPALSDALMPRRTQYVPTL